MSITLLDGILLVVTLLSAIMAMVRGFSREVLSIASWAAAAAVAFFFHHLLTPFLWPAYIADETIARFVAGIIVFFIALVIITIITMKIADIINDSSVGFLDRTLGFVFGAARGILIMVVAMLIFDFVVGEDITPSWISEAKSRPMLSSLGQQLMENLAAIVDQLPGEWGLDQYLQPGNGGTQDSA